MTFKAQLPPEAQELCRKIEAYLVQAEPLLSGAVSAADVYAMKETEERYLPETLQSFIAIPPSMREIPDPSGITPTARLIESLRTLERATRGHLQRLSATATESIAVNQAFLSQRFSDIEAEQNPTLELGDTSAQPAQSAALEQALSATLLRKFFAGVQEEHATSDEALLEHIAARFSQAFPRFTKIHKPFLRRQVQSVIIEIPQKDGAMCYVFENGRHGISASVSRIVRGIKLKTDAYPVDDVIAALFEHLVDFTETNQQERRQLNQVFGQ